MKRAKHNTDPHFNESGGCECTCPRCVQVRLRESAVPGGPVKITQLCICRGCNEDCPSDGRVVISAYAPTIPDPAWVRRTSAGEWEPDAPTGDLGPVLHNMPLHGVVTSDGQPVTLVVHRLVSGTVRVRLESPHSGPRGEDRLLAERTV